jgi:hypothetical protein
MTMGRRALLIGSPYGDLTGPPVDVERVAGYLAPRDFTIERCVNADATRERILHAYRSLIETATSGDAIVIYYSGHGGRSVDESYAPPGRTGSR